jgi:hypothetical protein
MRVSSGWRCVFFDQFAQLRPIVEGRIFAPPRGRVDARSGNRSTMRDLLLQPACGRPGPVHQEYASGESQDGQGLLAGGQQE